MGFVALDVFREAENLFADDVSIDVAGTSSDPRPVGIKVIGGPATGFGAVVPEGCLGAKEGHGEVFEVDGEFVGDEFIEGAFGARYGVVDAVRYLSERGFSGGFDAGVEVREFPADPGEFNDWSTVLGGVLAVLDEFIESAFEFEGFGP